METTPALADLITRTAEALKALAAELEAGKLVEPVEWVIPMADIGTPRMAEHCDAIAEALGRKHLAIYAICLDEAVPLDRIHAFVEENKARNKALPVDQRRAFARVNKRIARSDSRCLYVGKSEKAAERLRQHLIEAHPATFALHLAHWPQGLPGNLLVRVIGIAGVASALVPLIEDQLAREMPPILGRRGSV